MKLLIKSLLFLVPLGLAACAPESQTASPEGPRKLTVMTHDSFAVSEEVVAEFEESPRGAGGFGSSGR